MKRPTQAPFATPAAARRARPTLAATLALGALAASLAACTGGDDTLDGRAKVPAVAAPDGGGDFVHLTRKAGVVAATQEQSDAVVVEPDRLVFPAGSAAEVAKRWPVGAPVVGNRKNPGGTGVNPFGYLRKVKAITTEGDRVVVATEQATIDDVVEGEFAVTADPHALIPIDTSGVNLDDYFKPTGSIPVDAPTAGGADAGADSGDAGARASVPNVGLPSAKRTRAAERIGTVRQAFSVGGLWSDAKKLGEEVVDTVSQGASDLAGVGVSQAYDVSTFFDVSGTAVLFDVPETQAKVKVFTKKRGGSLNVRFAGSTALDGAVTARTTFHVGGTVGFAGLQKLDASLVGSVGVDATLRIAATVKPEDGTNPADLEGVQALINADPEQFEYEKTLLESPAFAGPIVAGIPTTLRLELVGDCKVGVAGTTTAAATAHFGAENVTAAVTYTFPGQWTANGAVTMQTSASADVSGGGGVSVECGLTPKVLWLFADLAGPYVGVRAGLKAKGLYNESCDPTSRRSSQANAVATLGLDGTVQVVEGGEINAFGVGDWGLGPYVLWRHDWPDLWTRTWSLPQKGKLYCPSHCDDGAKNADEPAVDCGGAICDRCALGAGCAGDLDCASGFCRGGACVDACHNGAKEPAEGDVDCGGPCAAACADGAHCRAASDCSAGFCRGTGICGPHCGDGVRDGDEADVDCGGSCTERCAVGFACNAPGDCSTGVCYGSPARCELSPCSDGTKNFGESDVDCGVACSRPCDPGKGCVVDADCLTGICSVAGMCVSSRCQDGYKNGTETNVDCGGGACVGCADGASCGASTDCLSGACHAYKHVCTSDTCNDGLKDGDEPSIDCGGTKCAGCGLGKGCKVGTDCASGACSTSGVCVPNSCFDGRKDANELDVDCGGTCPLACGQGKACAKPSDCLSGLCSGVTGKCIGNRCLDTVKNGDETDVDCGGACAKCALGRRCALAADCASGVCNAATGLCVATRCQDGQKDDAETGVDCGGGTCSPCGVGGGCAQDSDCVGVCAPGSKACVASHCFDGVKNADETALDCGGALCAGCQAGVACALDRDCLSGACGANSKCATSACADGRTNGAETDLDCGGGTCPGCAVGKVCASGGDCGSGACSASTHTCIAGCTSGAECATSICNLTSGKCVATLCEDGVLDGSETDVDCGGSCAGCPVDAACGRAADCASGACSATTSLCVADHCSDASLTGDESGVDCGGALCAGCANGVACKSGSDCASTYCNKTTKVCTADHCVDGLLDADETDVDCGGASCGACATGLVCKKGADCQTTYCSAYTKRCVTDHCSDGVTDGGEGDLDCGYMCSTKCANGQGCHYGDDCTSADCRAGFCVVPPTETSCKNHYDEGKTTFDGPYVLWLAHREQQVYCEMTSGGFTHAWFKHSTSCAEPSVYQGSANYGATSAMGTNWADTGDPLRLSPEQWSTIPAGGGCTHGNMDLRNNPSPYPGPAWTEWRVTSAENGVRTWTSNTTPRAWMAIDFGVDGWISHCGSGNCIEWCRGTSSFNAGGACKAHTGLGDGFDISWSVYANQGITVAETGMNGTYASGTFYSFATFKENPVTPADGQPGAAVAFWIR